MFAAASSTVATAAQGPAPDGARPMTNEELVAHQLDLHRRIQQQMQLQMEMSLELGQRRQSLTASIAKVEPDLGDNVFDMLDDLIMVAPERASLSKSAIEIDSDPTAGRDSLADIIESLDMDLDEFELGPIDASRDSLSDSPALDSMLDEERDSFDDSDLDFDDDLEDRTSDVMDHGVDDDDDGDDELSADSPFRVSKDPNEHAVSDVVGGRSRLSSSDMIASMANSMSSMSHNIAGNLCTLIWEGGLLGLRLRMSQSRMLPAVSKLTGRSSIYGIHLIDVGDLLLQIGDRPTKDMEFIEAINYLKELEKPCKLVFRRLHSDPMAVKPIQPPVKSALALKLSKKFEELTAAEEDKTPSMPLVKLEEKYEIKWLDGPLGISLIASKDAPYPLVTRITGKNRSPQVQDVQPGHYLVQIGTYNTADGNFNTAIKYLQKVSKPVSLYFSPSSKKISARPDPSSDEYDHVWEKKQPLGFTVRPDENGRMVVADVGSAKSVKLKPKGPPGLNASVGLSDLIMWINDDDTKDMSFHEALLKLRTAKRPLVIRFKKAPPEPPAEVRAPLPTPLPASVAPAPQAPPVSDVSPIQSVTKSTGRFNPLKKIAALGSYAKENSANSQNQRSNSSDPKKTPTETPTTKKNLSSTGTTDSDSRGDHHYPVVVNSPATVHHSVSGGHHSISREDSHSHKSSHNNESDQVSDPKRQESPQASRLINLDLLSGLRKPMIGKSSSDSNLPTPSSDVNTAQHSRHARNSAGRPVEHGSASSNDESDHRSHMAPSSSTEAERLDEYEVIWPEGTALGLTLRVHPTTRFPVVARVTGTSNLKNIEHVTPGDVLYQANGAMIVPQPKFKQTLENLSRLPKPAVLRFRRGGLHSSTSPAAVRTTDDVDRMLPRGPSSLKDHEYELIWRENSNLGLVFSSDGDIPRVSKVDPESGGSNVKIVSIGDILTCIGPMDIGGSSFHASMATLRAVRRPVVLRFQRIAP